MVVCSRFTANAKTRQIRCGTLIPNTPHWPQVDVVQVRFVDVKAGQRLCQERAKRESDMFPTDFLRWGFRLLQANFKGLCYSAPVEPAVGELDIPDAALLFSYKG
jgi:hypothetical protein